MAEKVITRADEDWLRTKDEIKDAFGLSEHMFHEYINWGMPFIYRNCRYSASKKKIQEWWEQTHSHSMKDEMELIRADERKVENFKKRGDRE